MASTGSNPDPASSGLDDLEDGKRRITGVIWCTGTAGPYRYNRLTYSVAGVKSWVVMFRRAHASGRLRQPVVNQ